MPGARQLAPTEVSERKEKPLEDAARSLQWLPSEMNIKSFFPSELDGV